MPGTTAENAESPPASPTQQPNRKAARNRLSCQVTLLDGTVFTTEMQKSAKGLDLVVWVTGQLNISEKEYFGLLFEDKKGEKYWLDPQKKITSQLKGAVPNFALAVKFYEPVPSQIKTDYTRYLMCMQIRDDINSGRLPCSFGNQAVLGSYIVQGDVGDFEVREHGEDYLDGMIFSPNQTQELLEKIKELHQENSGLSPEESDLQYLKIAAGKLILYGVDSHPARDEHGNEVLVGVSHDGLAVYKDRLVVNKIPWAKIDYLKYRKRNFIIKSHPGELDALTTITIYKTPSEKAAKRLYKSCVEHHTFFRLTFADPPPSRSSSLLKMGSKFRYSDRTLYQLRKDGEPIKNQPKFDRVSSRNWSRRYQMPSLSETRIYVDDKEDENRAKRPLSEGDMPSNVPLYLKRNPKQAPLIEEESNATMTPEEREQYQRQMAEKLGKRKPGEDDEDAIRASAVGGGVASYAYVTAEDRDRKARVTALEDENKRLEKERKEREEREREAREREARERDLEKERLAKERERERQMNEWIESEKRRFKPEVAGMAYTAPGGAYERANITIEEPKKSEEPEFVSMGVATPVSGGDTIKRAKMKVADTDSYQGRVIKMADSDKKQESPEISRTNTWGGGNRDNVSSYSRTYTSTTLPSRGAKITYDNKGAEMDRPRSANDLLDTNEREDRTRHSTGRVPLVTKEELVRIYSPGGAEMDSLGRPRDDAQHEIKRSLKDDLNLEHEQGEGGFVRENIKLNEGIIKRQSYRSDLESEPPEVTTRTMIINSEREPTVYRQNRAPEVATNVMTISSAGGKTPDSGAARGSTSPRYNDYSVGGVHQPYESHTREYTVPSVTTQKIVYDENGYPISPSLRETQDGGVLVTRTITMGGAEPHRTETIRQTTMPTEIIQKTITIEGDGDQLTAQELKDIIAQHAGDLGTSEVVTTTYTTKVQEVKQTKTITETMRVVDDDGNVIKTGDPDTDAAILEAIERAKQENPNMKVTEVVITRTDESTA